jgi:hypothetical protein
LEVLKISSNKGLIDKLDVAKEKAALREFEVTITETLQKTVTVTAKDRCEAEEMVQDQWDNQDHILDADSFKGVTFEAVPLSRSRLRDCEER